MTRPSINRIIVAVALVGLPILVTAHQWGPVVDAAPYISWQERMQCPAWQPGLSRTLVVMAHEDELGIITGVRCVRTQERKRRVM